MLLREVSKKRGSGRRELRSWVTLKWGGVGELEPVLQRKEREFLRTEISNTPF